MRVLVTWGSKRGGTEGLARMLGEALVKEGVEVSVLPPREALAATGFDAAIVGGALYANRWHRDARRFVSRREARLREVPVWFFSSGPRDDSASRGAIAPTRQVQTLMERVGALGHVTFGGVRLPDKDKKRIRKPPGDWRDPEQVRRFASEIAHALPVARPGRVVPQKGSSLAWLLLHGVVGWAMCAAAMGALRMLTTPAIATAFHALLAPAIFVVVARHYFQTRGAREPITTALLFIAIVAALDLGVVAGLIQHGLAMFASFVETWLPFTLIFLATYGTGELMSTLPWSRPSHPTKGRLDAAAARP